jgi:GNAT superfamily N-acetyltransferase
LALNISNRYPRIATLRDESTAMVRPMSRADESALVDFFRRIPETERFFLKDDVTSPGLIRSWIENLDFDYALPLLALDEHRIVGDAVLIRHRSASLQHSAEIRIVIDPDYRTRGLAVALINELIEVARDSGLEEVLFEFVRGQQSGAIEAAEFFGATVVGELPGWVRDKNNRPHDVAFLKLTL